jgi:hypothetical protein
MCAQLLSSTLSAYLNTITMKSDMKIEKFERVLESQVQQSIEAIITHSGNINSPLLQLCIQHLPKNKLFRELIYGRALVVAASQYKIDICQYFILQLSSATTHLYNLYSLFNSHRIPHVAAKKFFHFVIETSEMCSLIPMIILNLNLYDAESCFIFSNNGRDYEHKCGAKSLAQNWVERNYKKKIMNVLNEHGQIIEQTLNESLDEFLIRDLIHIICSYIPSPISCSHIFA